MYVLVDRMDRTLTDSTIPSQSGARNNSNKEVFYSLKSSRTKAPTQNAVIETYSEQFCYCFIRQFFPI